MMLSFSVIAHGQLKKATNYFEKEDYEKAIKFYEKANLKEPLNALSIKNLAFSYRKTNDNKNAEKYFAQAIVLNPADSSNYLYYGQALKNNYKFNAAKTQLEQFLAFNPSSLLAKLMVQACGEIISWELEESPFSVTIVENINSAYSDFSPVAYKDGIVFVSDRSGGLSNANDAGAENTPYLSLYYAKEEKHLKKAKAFSNKLAGNYHIGPICIANDGNLLYYTQSVDAAENGSASRLKIFSTNLIDGKWENTIPFQHNNPNYSVAHPALSKDGNYLFFASDMPGGFGGMDIYFCKKEAEKWGTPINAGEAVNTSGNEVFPYYRKDILYFSSDGHLGYGGLDIFITTKSSEWKDVINLKSPINSFKDDFGISYTDDTNGYFSSNRDKGVGEDDIYAFSWHKISPNPHLFVLESTDKLTTNQINLTNEDNKIIETTTIDTTGQFIFQLLEASKTYYLTLPNEYLTDSLTFYITNSKGEKVIPIHKTTDGKHQFNALPLGGADTLPLLNNGDEEVLTEDIIGQLYQELPGDYAGGVEVLIIDNDGNIIARTTTNKEGYFKFEKLPQDKQYMIKLAEEDAGLMLDILDQNGAVISSANKLEDGKYTYIKLQPAISFLSFMEEKDLKDLHYNANSTDEKEIMGQLYQESSGDYAAGTEVLAMDDDGNIIARTTTNKEGYFKLDKLPKDNQFSIELSDKRDDLKLNILDPNGIVISWANKLKDGKYKYVKTQPSTGFLSFMKEEDDNKKTDAYFIPDDVPVEEVTGQLSNLPKNSLEQTEIVAVDNKGNIIARTTVSKDGHFKFEKLPQDKQYMIKLAEDDAVLYIPPLNTSADTTTLVNHPLGGEKKQVVLEINFEKPKTEEQIAEKEKTDTYFIPDDVPVEEVTGQLSNLPKNSLEQTEIVAVDNEKLTFGFEYKSYEILAENQKVLNQVAINLSKDNSLRVEIGSHTDAIGGTAYNKELGQKRAYEAINYLVSKGISRNRIIVINYGQSQPIAPNTLPDGSDNPKGRAKNRRLEFEFFTFNFKYKSHKILGENQKVLDQIVVNLSINNNLRLEIGSHTDAIGGTAYNKELGQRRADEAVNYIVSKGISKNRIVVVNYGQSQPIAPNTLPDGSDNPRGRAKNRRLEFEFFTLKK